MIGNDVVDFKLACKQSNWRRKGFLEKVFIPSEQDIIRKSYKQDQTVWTLWSMKEAAYKVNQRLLQLPRQLNWKTFHCQFLEIGEQKVKGLVEVKDRVYFTTSEINADYIFTTATNTRNEVVESHCLRTSMKLIKENLLSHISDHYKVREDFLSVKKDDHGTPYVRYLQKEEFTNFSLTDHGKFAAFSLSLTNC